MKKSKIETKIRNLKLSYAKEADLQKSGEISKRIADEEAKLRQIEGQKAKKIGLETFQELEKDYKIFFYLPDETKCFRPKKIVHKAGNIFADEEVLAWNVPLLASEGWEDDVLCIFKTTEGATVVPIRFEDIQRARNQRINLVKSAKMADDVKAKILASIYGTAIGADKYSSLFTDEEALKKAMEESRNEKTIASDIHFITNMH